MNWAYRWMHHTPDVAQWVAAPWILDNGYKTPEFRYFLRPFQQKTGYLPQNEWQTARFYTQLIRLERYWPLYQNWLAQQIKQHRPDVLHAHFGPVGCQYLSLSERLDIPLLTSFYGYDLRRLPHTNPRYRAKYVQLFARGAAFTTTGPNTAEWLVDQGCSPQKITPIPLGIVPSEFPLSVRNKPTGQLKLLQVATVTPKKGMLDTLKAFQMARRHCPNLQLTLAGERANTAYFSAVRQFIRAHHLEKQVTVLDFVSHDTLRALFSAHDVFIHPSQVADNQDTEGAPVVILEAQCSGLPVISTHHADIPKQVTVGETGFLAPEKSPAELANYVQRFYHMSPETYHQMSLAAHHHVTQHFDVRLMGEKLRNLYQNLVYP